MPRIILIVLLIAAGCSPRVPTVAETAAVYEAFLEADPYDAAHVIVQDVEVPVSAGLFHGGSLGSTKEVSRSYLPEVRQAAEDLVARGRPPRPLPRAVREWYGEPPVSADSVQALFEHIRARSLRRLADSATIVQLSAVGFNRDRTVAVVYQSVVCGYLCGGATARVVRKHPGGWLAAEQLVTIFY